MRAVISGARWARTGLWAALVVSISACGLLEDEVEDSIGGDFERPDVGAGDVGVPDQPDPGDLPEIPEAGRVEDRCDDTTPCRPGLDCEDGQCAPSRASASGDTCFISVECQEGLQCVGGACAPVATAGVEGDACGTDLDCGDGLRCDLVGFSAVCAPQGEKDLKAPCDEPNECFAGLACFDGSCLPAPRGVPPWVRGLPWQGAECPDDLEGTRAYFEVPGVNSPTGHTGDFFRMPFPTDGHRNGRRIDLSGFPTPGESTFGFDPVQPYLDALSTAGAWGAHMSVIMRFSGSVDIPSFREGNDEMEPVNWVDVTEGHADFGRSEGLTWFLSGGRSAYVCNNWMAIRRPEGRPLRAGNTYAVWITTQGRDGDGNAIERSPQLEAVLAETAPGDERLAQVHAAYAPFRAYLASEGISPDTVLNAAVFTVDDVRGPMRELAAAASEADLATVSDWVKCGDGAESPCPQAEGNRACGAGAADYDEYHALIELPIFQRGEAPYEAPDDGGDIDTSGPVRTEQICAALTVPKGEMPESGWAVTLFGHGTGGSFRSHVREEVAGVLSRGERRFAVLGIDMPSHGPRRGDSEKEPKELFFNFLNPNAARGNPMQGGADIIGLTRLIETLEVPAEATGADVITFDASQVVWWSQSQGSVHGSLGVPWTSVPKGAVLSGNGAALLYSLLEKKSPVDISAAVPFVLQDADADGALQGKQYHPVLSLLQMWIDPADPLNFAETIGRIPPEGVTPKHVLQTYGHGDTFTPPRTLAIYAQAGRFGQAAPDVSVAEPAEISRLAVSAGPLEGNVSVDGEPYTLGLRQYGPPEGRDGHFVVFDLEAANADVQRFLRAAAAGEVPVIGE
jgi:hypothetical protein